MTLSSKTLSSMLAWIDTQNQSDPRVSHNEHGVSFPRETLYAKRMEHMLFKICKTPSFTLHVAVYGQHICRWQIPRDTYPMDREGYLSWRKNLQIHHAALLEKGLKQHHVDDDTISSIKNLVQKIKFRAHPEGQILEDVSCLVFLVYEFEEFARQHTDEKIISILQKTWKKMSSKGQSTALLLLPTLNISLQNLINRALVS